MSQNVPRLKVTLCIQKKVTTLEAGLFEFLAPTKGISCLRVPAKGIFSIRLQIIHNKKMYLHEEEEFVLRYSVPYFFCDRRIRHWKPLLKAEAVLLSV